MDDKSMTRIKILEKKTRRSGGAARMEFLARLAGATQETIMDALNRDMEEALFVLNTAATMLYSEKYGLGDMVDEILGTDDEEDDEDEDEEGEDIPINIIKVDTKIDEENASDIIKKIIDLMKEEGEESGESTTSQKTRGKKKPKSSADDD